VVGEWFKEKLVVKTPWHRGGGREGPTPQLRFVSPALPSTTVKEVTRARKQWEAKLQSSKVLAQDALSSIRRRPADAGLRLTDAPHHEPLYQQKDLEMRRELEDYKRVVNMVNSMVPLTSNEGIASISSPLNILRRHGSNLQQGPSRLFSIQQAGVGSPPTNGTAWSLPGASGRSSLQESRGFCFGNFSLVFHHPRSSCDVGEKEKERVLHLHTQFVFCPLTICLQEATVVNHRHKMVIMEEREFPEMIPQKAQRRRSVGLLPGKHCWRRHTIIQEKLDSRHSTMMQTISVLI